MLHLVPHPCQKRLSTDLGDRRSAGRPALTQGGEPAGSRLSSKADRPTDEKTEKLFDPAAQEGRPFSFGGLRPRARKGGRFRLWSRPAALAAGLPAKRLDPTGAPPSVPRPSANVPSPAPGPEHRTHVVVGIGQSHKVDL